MGFRPTIVPGEWGEHMRNSEELSTYEQGVRIRKVLEELGITETRQMEKLILHTRKNPIDGVEENYLRWYAKDILDGKWPNPPAYPEDELRKSFSRMARKAAIAKVKKGKVTDPLASKFYGCPALPPGTPWPQSGEGQPMIFLGQFNLERIGVELDVLKGTAMLSIFVADIDTMDIWDEEPVVMAFRSLEGLVPHPVPEGAEGPKERELRFKVSREYPDMDDPNLPLPDGADPETIWKTNIPDVMEDFPNDGGTKVGGWPNTLQTNYALGNMDVPLVGTGVNPFVLQISTYDADMDVGDIGTLYIARYPDRGPPAPLGDDGWFFEFQMC